MSTLTEQINACLNEYIGAVDGKTVQDLGGTDAAIILCINHIGTLYNISHALSQTVDNFAASYNESMSVIMQGFKDINAQFTEYNTLLSNITASVADADSSLAKNVDNTLTKFGTQLSDRDKMLNAQLNKLNKNIGKAAKLK
jgi:ABC-type transporter Mla subunit MlaD